MAAQGAWTVRANPVDTSTVLVAGEDRYATSAEVARLLGGGSLTGLDRLIVASGENPVDAMSASGLAGYLDGGGRTGRTAILLTRTNSLPPVVAGAISSSGVAASRVFVVGGPSAVTDSVVEAIGRAAGWAGTGTNPVTRIGGANRYATAAAIVEYVARAAGGALPDSYRTVLVANGDTVADALAAGALGYRNGHLMVLSSRSSAPQVVLEAVTRLGANCAVALGGRAAVADAVVGQVRAVLAPGGCGVERIGGVDRYETATLVADRFVRTNGTPSQVMLTSGVQWADAMSAAPLAGANRPLVLSGPTGLPPATTQWIETNGPGLNQVIVIGGPASVSPAVVEQAQAARRNGIANTPLPASAPAPTTTIVPPLSGGGWAARAGGPLGDIAWSVSALADGSAIVAGQFTGTVNFGSITLTSAGAGVAGESDAFVAKVAPDGSWVWATPAGSTGDDQAKSVSVLPDGSAVVAGTFNGTATFGSLPNLVSAGDADMFVAKVGPNGAWLWATAAGGPGYDLANGVSVAADGSARLVGRFDTTATFGATTLTNTGGYGLVAAKVDPNGSWAWATQSGLPSAGGSGEGNAVSVLPDGSAIVTGSMIGTVRFGTLPDLVSAGNRDIVVAKIDTNGTWVWATSAGATRSETGLGVAVSPDGSAIVTGAFSESVIFGGTTLTSAGRDDAFVAKVSSTGSWVWATAAGGTDNDQAVGVSALSDGSAIVTGRFFFSATVGGTTLTSAWGDAFIAKIDASGTWAWATQVSSADGSWVYGVSALADGSATVAGQFRGTANFGGTALTSAGIDDVYVARVDAAGSFG